MSALLYTDGEWDRLRRRDFADALDQEHLSIRAARSAERLRIEAEQLRLELANQKGFSAERATDRVNEFDRNEIARLAATIAGGIEAGRMASPDFPDGFDAEETAARAVRVARAIIAEAAKP